MALTDLKVRALNSEQIVGMAVGIASQSTRLEGDYEEFSAAQW